jgi:hypothetical protein
MTKEDKKLTILVCVLLYYPTGSSLWRKKLDSIFGLLVSRTDLSNHSVFKVKNKSNFHEGFLLVDGDEPLCLVSNPIFCQWQKMLANIFPLFFGHLSLCLHLLNRSCFGCLSVCFDYVVSLSSVNDRRSIADPAVAFAFPFGSSSHNSLALSCPCNRFHASQILAGTGIKPP